LIFVKPLFWWSSWIKVFLARQVVPCAGALVRLPISHEDADLLKASTFSGKILVAFRQQSLATPTHYLTLPQPHPRLNPLDKMSKQSNPGAFSVADTPPETDIKLKDPTAVSIDRDPAASDPVTRSTRILIGNNKEKPFRFIATWHFWGILVLGQILSWCIVSTNTLTEYLSLAGANIPAFQSLFNYALLAVVYLSYTLYKYGFKKVGLLMFKDGWKFFIFAFADVQGVPSHLLLRGMC